MLWVVVPALNEAENLRELLPPLVGEVTSLDPDGRVLVVDDGSSDRTSATVGELMMDLPCVELRTLGLHSGKAVALREGLAHALALGATTVVTMDADGQDDPADLELLLAALEHGADVVTGVRRGTSDGPVRRRVVRWQARAAALVSGVPDADAGSAFTAMTDRAAAALAPLLAGERHRYLGVLAHGLGQRVARVPIDHRPRLHGRNSHPWTGAWRGVPDLVTTRFLLGLEHRPAHLAGALGAGCGLVGLLGVLHLGLGADAPGEDRGLLLAGLLLVVGVQLALFGVLAELVVHARDLEGRTAARSSSSASRRGASPRPAAPRDPGLRTPVRPLAGAVADREA
ncbi:glycosyltransferase family 2 protein [Nocardioides sp. GY 10127]|uniref:glycosyltransferase family 2 protein n=1 Tax=Nocardioides sp. GY 10127 TaxID=2569762 RepID=UPI00145875F3|nr:glycosyltransferase family 2 protein [Nocardioides sp. GY 10127]